MRIVNGMVRAALLLAALLPALAGAQAYPSKPVRIIVPFPAGGLTDVLARGLAQELNRAWGQPVIVENRPGANTIIAAEATARSAADGYTLLLANDPTVSANQYLYNKLPYDPVKDLAPVINLVQGFNVLVTSPNFPAKTLPELIAMAKAKPGTITYGTFGLGSATHIDTEALAALTDIKLVHIPYKGIAEVLPAVMSGQIDVALSGVPPTLPLVKSGKLRVIAVPAPSRLPVLPEVPTFAEAGTRDFISRSWFGFVVAAGTPKAVIDKIAADISRVITQPEFQERYITGVGLILLNQGPEQFAEFLKADRATYQARTRNLNVKLD